MTIRTLEFIHNQLIKAHTERREIHDNAKTLLEGYRDVGASEELIEAQRLFAAECRKDLREAAKALYEFEAQEWTMA